MPSTIGGTLEYALFMAQHLNHCDVQYVVLAVLLDLGLSPKREGFAFLRKAIVMRYEDSSRILKNDIYDAIAQAQGSFANDQQIEQAIRGVIKEGWANRDDEVWRNLFPKGKNGKITRPSNADFIARLACFIELWQGCCKGVAYAGK